jgi:hypothetical protein
LRLLQRAFAEELSEPSAVYRVLDTTLIPAIVRVRASGKGLFAGQASFGKQSGWTGWSFSWFRLCSPGSESYSRCSRTLVSERSRSS